ncbi:MAG: ABC-2 transporter permease [Vescimonas sp.]
MKGLVWKDIYTLLKQAKFILLLMVLFACLPGYSMSAFAIFYGAMLPITALAYDERSKWDELAAMMPYSVKEIVGSKYVLGLLLVGGISALSIAARIVIGIIKATPFDAEGIISILILACLSLVLLMVDLPLMFRLGVEKGRIIYILLTCVGVVAGVSYIDQLMAVLDSMMVSTMLLIVLLVTAVGLGVSYCISARIYRVRRG